MDRIEQGKTGIPVEVLHQQLSVQMGKLGFLGVSASVDFAHETEIPRATFVSSDDGEGLKRLSVRVALGKPVEEIPALWALKALVGDGTAVDAVTVLFTTQSASTEGGTVGRRQLGVLVWEGDKAAELLDMEAGLVAQGVLDLLAPKTRKDILGNVPEIMPAQMPVERGAELRDWVVGEAGKRLGVLPGVAAEMLYKLVADHDELWVRGRYKQFTHHLALDYGIVAGVWVWGRNVKEMVGSYSRFADMAKLGRRSPYSIALLDGVGTMGAEEVVFGFHQAMTDYNLKIGGGFGRGNLPQGVRRQGKNGMDKLGFGYEAFIPDRRYWGKDNDYVGQLLVIAGFSNDTMILARMPVVLPVDEPVVRKNYAIKGRNLSDREYLDARVMKLKGSSFRGQGALVQENLFRAALRELFIDCGNYGWSP